MRGKEFKPLAESTKKPRKHGFRPLIKQGHMMRSIHARRGGKNVAVVEIRRTDRKRIAPYHHYGTDKIPERAFFGINPKHLNKLVEILDKMIMDEIKKVSK